MSYKSDPNELRTCPYDSSHQIASSKFQNHIIKCKKSHPQKARQLETCPFNATHLVPDIELQNHVLSCPDRKNVLRSISKDMPKPKLPSPQTSRKPINNKDEEDWDDDEPKVPIKIEDDEIKIEKVVRSAQEVKQLTNKRTERRNDDDDDDEDDELEKKPSKKPMGRGILQRK